MIANIVLLITLCVTGIIAIYSTEVMLTTMVEELLISSQTNKNKLNSHMALVLKETTFKR